jgi:hypothetical protein
VFSQVDLEDLVLRCRSQNAKAYIKEAVDSYRVGAYRSCIAATWIATVYDILDKLRELAIAGDKSASDLLAEYARNLKADDVAAAMKFEREILGVARDKFEFISVTEFTDLDRIRSDRNRCSHPILDPDFEVYTPTPELARAHLRAAVELMLGRPPMQGRAAFESIRSTIESAYFPDSEGAAETILRATPLSRAKPGVVRQISLGCAVSVFSEELDERQVLQRLSALLACRRMHPSVFDEGLRLKLDQKILNIADNRLSRCVVLLDLWPDCQPWMTAPTWERLRQFVLHLPTEEVKALHRALRVPPLHEAARTRVETLDEKLLIALVHSATGGVSSVIVDAVIRVYRSSGSFDTANRVARFLLRPLLKDMSAVQVECVIDAASNGEVHGSFEYAVIVGRILADPRFSGLEAIKGKAKQFGVMIDKDTEPEQFF